MNKLHWIAVAAVLGLGLLTQIPHHDHTADDLHDHQTERPAAPAGTTAVTLAVSGMT